MSTVRNPHKTCIDNTEHLGLTPSEDVWKHAKIITAKREQKCQICGYNRHVEVCHKKKISDFPMTTLISEVNNPENLVLLCPNHHWEFDNGLLGLAGFEPAVGYLNPTDYESAPLGQTKGKGPYVNTLI